MNPRLPHCECGSFSDYAKKLYAPRVAQDRARYARKYGHCLEAHNLAELLILSPSKRAHIMAALAALAKFQGIYGTFQRLVKDYGLRWQESNNAQLMIARMTKCANYDDIFNWIKTVKARRPRLTDFMNFMAVTGLRFSESVASYNLIIRLSHEGRLSDYYNAEREILEHYKFAQQFIRRTKKAFVSIVPNEIIAKIGRAEPLREGCIATLVRRAGLRLRFGDIREAHATLLTKFLRESEINFLQGRVGMSIFMAHYFNPALIKDLRERTMNAIAAITQLLNG